jgi:hypothetical protein
MTFHALQSAGFEKRGEVIRLVQTLRGGFKPKGSEEEFADVSGMPGSCWEPWGIFRKRFDGTMADNLRQWGTGGLRRRSKAEPFKDVIVCSPMRGAEKEIAPHPSLKPQRFLRQIVALPFLWAWVSFTTRSREAGRRWLRPRRMVIAPLVPTAIRNTFDMARTAFPKLAALQVREQ